MTDFFSKIFNTNKNNQKKQQLLVDIHSHLIPGIDDGVKTTFEAVKLIREFEQMGYKKLVITPHIMSHRYKNSSDIILEKLEFLKDAVTEYEIEMELEAASEYYLDDYFLTLLKKRDILTFNGNHLLFEMSYTRAPTDLMDIIFEMEQADYQPILAHPERYIFLHDSFEEYEALKDYGVLFQVNINSLAGYYNKGVQKIAHQLVEKGMVDFLGSDTHKPRQVETLKKYIQTPQFQKIFEKNTIRNNALL